MAKMTITGTPEQIEKGIETLCPRCSLLDREVVAKVMLKASGMPEWIWGIEANRESFLRAADAVIAHIEGKK